MESKGGDMAVIPAAAKEPLGLVFQESEAIDGWTGLEARSG